MEPNDFRQNGEETAVDQKIESVHHPVCDIRRGNDSGIGHSSP